MWQSWFVEVSVQFALFLWTINAQCGISPFLFEEHFSHTHSCFVTEFSHLVSMRQQLVDLYAHKQL